MNKFIFLSKDFYNAYPQNIFTEIEQKTSRPYIQICVTVCGIDFAIPLRSNIKHSNVLWTDKANHCGVDFSKAVVIEKPDYIDTKRTPYIRPNEFKALKGKEYIIQTKMQKFIEKYKKAKANAHIKSNAELCLFSTLQYFEKYFM